ncbi:MAG: N-acetylglucosamine kinase [Melioribacteraceae bacterium]
MSLFVGIDGGGSKTKCVLADDKLNILSRADGGPSNPLTVGVEQSASLLTNLIKELSLNFNLQEIDSAVIGLAGAGKKSESGGVRNAIIELLSREKIILKNLEIVSDAEIAIEGAFSGKAGAILIAGTGSIIFGKNRAGELIRTGGNGRILGDEGSGYSIGRKGLTAVAKQFDGRGKNTLLAEILNSEYGIKNRDDLIEKVYNEKFDIAGLAKNVIAAAEMHDNICMKILNEEIKELIVHIKSLKKNLAEKKIKLCLSGGLLSSKNYYSKELKKKIEKTFGDVKLTKADYPPEIGATLLAIKKSTTT